MLNEQQTGRYRLWRLLTYNVTIEESLQIVVAVIGNVGCIKDGIHICQILVLTGSGFVVDDADAILAGFRIRYHIQTVNVSANDRIAVRHIHTFLESDDGERRQFPVNFE